MIPWAYAWHKVRARSAVPSAIQHLLELRGKGTWNASTTLPFFGCVLILFILVHPVARSCHKPFRNRSLIICVALRGWYCYLLTIVSAADLPQLSNARMSFSSCPTTMLGPITDLWGTLLFKHRTSTGLQPTVWFFGADTLPAVFAALVLRVSSRGATPISTK